MNGPTPYQSHSLKQPDFLPTSREEMEQAGWSQLDVLFISGDAYVDHPSFGVPLLGRWLVAHGFRVGVVSQPQWTGNDPTADIMVMGKPRLFTAVSAGAIDSMLAHYTAFRKKRSDDAYTPGGMAGARPNRAVLVYTSLVRQAFPGTPVLIGGIEASLRRISHFDFWTDKIRHSILLDSKADLLVYGMGERAIVDAAKRLDADPEDDLRGIQGTVWACNTKDRATLENSISLPSFEDVRDTPAKLMKATLTLEQHVHNGDVPAVQQDGQRFIIVEPPAAPLEEKDMDALYDLPFSRRAHPVYTEEIPADSMIRHSITSHRGCGGGCSFCSLAQHQGRRIRSRSRSSILREARNMRRTQGFTGAISDVGGPSANMWNASCSLKDQTCKRSSCMFPNICPNFEFDADAHFALLDDVGTQEGIRNVRVASGIRFDLALRNRKNAADFISRYVGGQLKIAPEHICDHVLDQMRKPGQEVFLAYLNLFADVSRKTGKKQFVIPYLMSGFPGTTDSDMRELADFLKKRGWKPQQVQCFIPTPGTVATAMFYSGLDPKGNPIHVARTDAERLRQHGILVPERSRSKGSSPKGGSHGSSKGGPRGKSQGAGGKKGLPKGNGKPLEGGPKAGKARKAKRPR